MSIFNILYTYRKTRDIENSIINIEVLKKVLDYLPKSHLVEEALRHKSLLRSSLFSAKIEGNRLKLSEVENLKEKSKSIEKKEVFNILSALSWIYLDNAAKRINENLISKLHKLVLKGISEDAGHFRKEASAIFNEAGVAVYLTPPPLRIPELVKKVLIFLKTNKEHPLIKAAVSHFMFEKIHPFLDGNGRVGRLLCVCFLKNSGYDFRGLAAFEEYLNNHKEEYYYLLSMPKKDITYFVEFFLKAISVSVEDVVTKLQNGKEEDSQNLLPRRAEILEIIKDHKMVSFDFIKRRFQKIPQSSIHFDLRMLIKAGFIRKLGKTRGVVYCPKV